MILSKLHVLDFLVTKVIHLENLTEINIFLRYPDIEPKSGSKSMVLWLQDLGCDALLLPHLVVY